MNYIWNSRDGDFFIQKVVSADTIDVAFNLPFNTCVTKRVKLARVVEVVATRAEAQEWLQGSLSKTKNIKLITHKVGAYGPYLVDIFLDGVHLNKTLVTDGLCTEYKRRR